MRRALLAVLVAAVLAGISVATALGAANPSGTGQPNQSCGSDGATSEPAGFFTGGFANAEIVYAGSDGTQSAANGASQAVSQYDVACFQVTAAGR